MDGIKTGYIRASGFNLAASAVRDGRRLIAVVMGGESARSRDMKMAMLLEETFARPADDNAEMVEDDAPGDGRETLAHRAGRALAVLSPVAKAEAATDADAATQRREGHGRAGDGWSIQVGAYTQHEAAERAAEQALQRSRRRQGPRGPGGRAGACRQRESVPRAHRPFLASRSASGLPHAAEEA